MDTSWLVHASEEWICPSVLCSALRGWLFPVVLLLGSHRVVGAKFLGPGMSPSQVRHLLSQQRKISIFWPQKWLFLLIFSKVSTPAESLNSDARGAGMSSIVLQFLLLRVQPVWFCYWWLFRGGFFPSFVFVLSRVQLFATPWTVAHQAPPSIELTRQE